MDRYMWKGRVLPGKREEYIRRHDEIWPEMVAVLKEAGISNYTIWMDDEGGLTGYYECSQSAEHAARVQGESPVVDKWNEYMQDVLEIEMDKETGAQKKLTQVFLME